MKVKIILSVLLAIILLDCTVSTAETQQNYVTDDVYTASNNTSTTIPYATYDPDGWSSKPYLQFHNGEINDPEYLATHIIWKNNASDPNVTTQAYWVEQDIFVPYKDGWKFNGVYEFNYFTGSYNLSDKTTYFEGNTSYGQMELIGGPYSFSNSTIYSSPKTMFTWVTVPVLRNCWFSDLGSIKMATTPSEGFEVYNITSIGTMSTISTQGTNTLHNASFHDMHFERTRGFLAIANATNTTCYNITANGTLPNNGMTGLVFSGGGTTTSNFEKYTGGNNNRAWNITLECTDRSGFDLTGFEHDFYGQDIIVNGSGHNCIDLHGQWNVTLVNIEARNSKMEGFMITTGNYGTNASAMEADLHIHDRTGAINERTISTVSHNISIYNLDVCNSAGSDLSINRFIDVWIENVTSNDTDAFITSNYCENLTIINATAANQRSAATVTLGTSYGTYGSEGYANDTKFVDFYMTGKGTVKPYIYLMHSRNTSLINYYSTGMSGTGVSFYNGHGCDYTKYYYPNLKVVDLNGNPMKGAIVTVNDTSRNGYGAIQTEYRTDDNGKLYDKGNRSNWLAVPDEFRNDSGYVYYTPEITATSGKYTNSIVVNPDSTWYSQNSSDLQGPEIVLILNVKDPDDLCVLPYVNFTSNVD